MAQVLYVNTLKCTYNNLNEVLGRVGKEAFTEDKNKDNKITIRDYEGRYFIEITDPENIIIDSSYTPGSLGYIIRQNIKKEVFYDLSPTDLTQATLISYVEAFKDCTNLIAIDDLPSESSESDLESAKEMFSGCKNLQSADLSALVHVINIEEMFKDCECLDIVTISQAFNLKIGSRRASLFRDCVNLRNVFISDYNQDVTFTKNINITQNLNVDRDVSVKGNIDIKGNFSIDGFLKAGSYNTGKIFNENNYVKLEPFITSSEYFLIRIPDFDGTLQLRFTNIQQNTQYASITIIGNRTDGFIKSSDDKTNIPAVNYLINYAQSSLNVIGEIRKTEGFLCITFKKNGYMFYSYLLNNDKELDISYMTNGLSANNDKSLYNYIPDSQSRTLIFGDGTERYGLYVQGTLKSDIEEHLTATNFKEAKVENFYIKDEELDQFVKFDLPLVKKVTKQLDETTSNHIYLNTYEPTLRADDIKKFIFYKEYESYPDLTRTIDEFNNIVFSSFEYNDIQCNTYNTMYYKYNYKSIDTTETNIYNIQLLDGSIETKELALTSKKTDVESLSALLESCNLLLLDYSNKYIINNNILYVENQEYLLKTKVINKFTDGIVYIGNDTSFNASEIDKINFSFSVIKQAYIIEFIKDDETSISVEVRNNEDIDNIFNHSEFVSKSNNRVYPDIYVDGKLIHFPEPSADILREELDEHVKSKNITISEEASFNNIKVDGILTVPNPISGVIDKSDTLKTVSSEADVLFYPTLVTNHVKERTPSDEIEYQRNFTNSGLLYQGGSHKQLIVPNLFMGTVQMDSESRSQKYDPNHLNLNGSINSRYITIGSNNDPYQLDPNPSLTVNGMNGIKANTLSSIGNIESTDLDTGNKIIKGVPLYLQKDSDGDIVFNNNEFFISQNGAYYSGTSNKSINDEDGLNIKETYIKNNQRGVANGVATLDQNGRIPKSQLNLSVLTFMGKVYVDSGKPKVNYEGYDQYLVDDETLGKTNSNIFIPENGDTFIVSGIEGTSGSINIDFSNGENTNVLSLSDGDWVIYSDADKKWIKSENSHKISSINGITYGDVNITLENLIYNKDNSNKSFYLENTNFLKNVDLRNSINIDNHSDGKQVSYTMYGNTKNFIVNYSKNTDLIKTRSLSGNEILYLSGTNDFNNGYKEQITDQDLYYDKSSQTLNVLNINTTSLILNDPNANLDVYKLTSSDIYSNNIINKYGLSSETITTKSLSFSQTYNLSADEDTLSINPKDGAYSTKLSLNNGNLILNSIHANGSDDYNLIGNELIDLNIHSKQLNIKSNRTNFGNYSLPDAVISDENVSLNKLNSNGYLSVNSINSNTIVTNNLNGSTVTTNNLNVPDILSVYNNPHTELSLNINDKARALIKKESISFFIAKSCSITENTNGVSIQSDNGSTITLACNNGAGYYHSIIMNKNGIHLYGNVYLNGSQLAVI